MSHLLLLDVRNNQLSALPASLGQANSLLELKAGFNKIRELPDSLGMLLNLKTLDLRNNLIQVSREQHIRTANNFKCVLQFK